MPVPKDDSYGHDGYYDGSMDWKVRFLSACAVGREVCMCATYTCRSTTLHPTINHRPTSTSTGTATTTTRAGTTTTRTTWPRTGRRATRCVEYRVLSTTVSSFIPPAGLTHVIPTTHHANNHRARARRRRRRVFLSVLSFGTFYAQLTLVIHSPQSTTGPRPQARVWRRRLPGRVRRRGVRPVR